MFSILHQRSIEESKRRTIMHVIHFMTPPLLFFVPDRTDSSRLGWPVERLFLPMTCPGNSAATLNSRLRRSPSTSGAGRKSWIWVAATKRLAFLQVAMSRGRDALERYLATVDD